MFVTQAQFIYSKKQIFKIPDRDQTNLYNLKIIHDFNTFT